MRTFQTLMNMQTWLHLGEGLSRSRGIGVFGLFEANMLAAEFLENGFLSDDWALLNQQTGVSHDEGEFNATA